jgi:hypothetical protein
MMRAISAEQAISLLTERRKRIGTTSPLHSEGIEIGGMSKPRLFVGYLIGTDLGHKLAEEYIAHRQCQRSKLGEFVDDVSLFMQKMQETIDMKSEHHNATIIPEEEDEEHLDDWTRNDLAMKRRNIIDAICTMVFLELKTPHEVQAFQTVEYGNEFTSIIHRNMLVGKEIDISHPTPGEIRDKIQRAEEELKGIEFPPEMRGDISKLTVVIEGDTQTGTCFQA